MLTLFMITLSLYIPLYLIWTVTPGSVVGGSYVRSGNALPLYYPAGSDVIQGGYYIPMRPPGMGPYPPGYNPKFPLPTTKTGTTGPENRECKPEEETPRVSEYVISLFALGLGEGGSF